MACLATYDLIAYPGKRYQTIFKANTNTELVANLKAALLKCDWLLEADDKHGWKATSKQVPWCVSEFIEAKPDDFIGKCKVQFYPNHDSGIFGTLTRFFVMNESETMKMSESIEIYLRPTVDNYSNYKYYFIGNQFQFVIFMLGVNNRDSLNIDNRWTSLIAGTPQIPKFLQATASVDLTHVDDTHPLSISDSNEFCKYGIRELFFIWQTDNARHGALYGHTNPWCGGIKSQFEECVNNSQGTNSPMIHSGIEGGGIFGTSTVETGNWVDNGESSPADWDGLFYSPIISWLTKVTDPYARLKGFLWDAVVINKSYNADDILNFDKHNFIVFNTFIGDSFPNRPPQALCFAISGAV